MVGSRTPLNVDWGEKTLAVQGVGSRQRPIAKQTRDTDTND